MLQFHAFLPEQCLRIASNIFERCNRTAIPLRVNDLYMICSVPDIKHNHCTITLAGVEIIPVICIPCTGPYWSSTLIPGQETIKDIINGYIALRWIIAEDNTILSWKRARLQSVT